MKKTPDKSTVVVPVLDIVKTKKDNNDIFENYVPITGQTGGFNWKLEFGWKDTPHLRNHSYRLPDPFPTPAMSGGIFAIWREYWERIGTYDTGMKEWGGEHIELSMRVWRCGGRVEIVP